MSTLNTYNLKSPDSANTNLALDASGNVAIQAGSASAPSIYVAGDSNTGLYSLGADQLAVTTGGTGRLFIDSSGRVGIGTSTVDELLHLKGASAASTTLKVESTATASERSSIHFFNGSVSRGRVGGSNDFDGLTLDSSTTESAAAIRFRTGGTSLTTKMTLTSGGSLGIGTTTVSDKLHVDAGNITLSYNGASTGLRNKLSWRTESPFFDEQAYIAANRTASSGAPTDIVFATAASAGAATEKCRLTSDGKLLVGTSSAGSTYRIGTTSFTPRVQFQGTDVSPLAIQRTDGPSHFFISTGQQVLNNAQIGVLSFNSSDGTNLVQSATIESARDGASSSGSVAGRLVFSTTADGASSPTERMRIRSDGAILAGSSGDGTWHGSVFSRLTGNVNRGFLFVNTGSGIGPLPCEANGTTTDNTTIFGFSSARWSVIYAATGTINTSDLNEKQDVHDLSAAELAVAQELKTLLKTFRWKEAVRQKGDDARIHVGVMAQDVEAAFQRHGLDATRYALWCKDTWYEVDGKSAADDGSFYTAESPGAVERTRLGIRYDQLLAFVLAAL